MTEHSDPVSAFRDAMSAGGVPYSGVIIADGKIHRVDIDGERRGKKNGFYLLHNDERPAGMFGSWGDGGGKTTWSMKGAKPLSAAEKQALRDKCAADMAKREADIAATREAAKAKANEVWAAAAPAENNHPYLRKKRVESYGLRVATWRREFGHDQNTGEVREMAVPDALLIPMRDSKKEIHSLQAVFPNKENQLKRDKDFLAGGAKRGLWYAIGKPTLHEGRKLVMIAEGYATAATIHAATGYGVLVAFDAGNLQPVAEAVRKIMPDAILLIAADNDQWSKVGDVENPGVHRANEAAQAVGGGLVIPAFKDVTTKPTDFNDLMALEGIDEVRRQIADWFAPDPYLAGVKVAPAALPEPPDGEEEPPPHDDLPVAAVAVASKPEPKARAPRASRPPPDPDDDTDEDGPKPDAYFRVLGHDRDHIYVYSQEKKMVVRRSETAWSKDGLFSIAPLQWWEMYFQGEKCLAKDAAVNWLMRVAFKRGFYDPSKSRGRGAWIDDGRIIYHFGDRLFVDGVETMSVTAIKSEYVYEQGRKLPPPASVAMTDAEGRQLLAITRQFRWTRPASAVLLAGAVALAPICGALKWRPHVWITGGQGTGKSTVLNDFVHALMGGTAVFAQGNSTEAGIRQTLGNDALPVLFDETEQNNEREEMRMQSCLSLIRQASTESEARTLKGTTHGAAMHFMVRSMFFLSSIQVGIRHQADYARISILSLRAGAGKADQDSWETLRADLAAMNSDKDLPARLVRRTLNLLPITLQNIATFTQAAAAKFGSQREGDQYGALLAGAWSLASSRLATMDEAADAIDRYDWSEYRENSEQDESNKALSAILSALIRMPRGETITVHELACRAAGRSVETVDTTPAVAEAVLRRHGMAIVPHGPDPVAAELLVSNNSTELQKLLAGTPFAADIKGQLLRVNGALNHTPVSFNGVKSRCVSIPMSEIIGDDPAPRFQPRDPGDDDVPF
jgi:putative DNA primase/helicase